MIFAVAKDHNDFCGSKRSRGFLITKYLLVDML